jgi:hypothetical protein
MSDDMAFLIVTLFLCGVVGLGIGIIITNWLGRR